MYAACNLDLLLIQLGKITSSAPAAANYLTAVYYELTDYVSEDETVKANSDLYTLEQMVADTETYDDESIGKQCAILLSNIIQFVVPVAEVNTFGYESGE